VTVKDQIQALILKRKGIPTPTEELATKEKGQIKVNNSDFLRLHRKGAQR